MSFFNAGEPFLAKPILTEEEEKVFHDISNYLYNNWDFLKRNPLPIFENNNYIYEKYNTTNKNIRDLLYDVYRVIITYETDYNLFIEIAENLKKCSIKDENYVNFCFYIQTRIIDLLDCEKK